MSGPSDTARVIQLTVENDTRFNRGIIRKNNKFQQSLNFTQIITSAGRWKNVVFNNRP